MVLSDEESKAIQEVAKTAAHYKDSATAFGAFFNRVVGHPLQQAGGLVGDTLGIVRIEMALRFMKRVERIMEERGMDGPRRALPLAIAYPLLEAATLEEDETLSEMFAELLVNAISDEEAYIPKSFVETIKGMSPIEAAVLRAMADAPAEAKGPVGMMYTKELPHCYLPAPTPQDKGWSDPPANIALALSALISSGCVLPMILMNGGWTTSQCRVSDYGVAFVKACRPPADRGQS